MDNYEFHDDEEVSVFYKRMLPQGTDLVDHAATLGICLRSKGLLNTRDKRYPQGIKVKADTGSQIRLYNRLTQSAHPDSRGSRRYPKPMYIQDVVVPLSKTTDGYSERSPSTSRYISTVRSRSALPRVQLLPSSTYSERSSHIQPQSEYNQTSSPRERQTVLSSVSGHEGKSEWNSSGQAKRFENGQTSLAQCRTMKRTTEVRPHRTDQMYYMSGTSLNLKPRFNVDDTDLQRLKNMSRARKDSSHYGRGLSHDDGTRNIQDSVHEKELPRQPPPSSLGDHNAQANVAPEGSTGGPSAHREAQDSDDDMDSISPASDRQENGTGKEGTEERTAPGTATESTRVGPPSPAFITQQEHQAESQLFHAPPDRPVNASQAYRLERKQQGQGHSSHGSAPRSEAEAEDSAAAGVHETGSVAVADTTPEQMDVELDNDEEDEDNRATNGS